MNVLDVKDECNHQNQTHVESGELDCQKKEVKLQGI